MGAQGAGATGQYELVMGSYQPGWWSGVAGSMPMDSAALGSPERGGDVEPTDPIQYSILSRWVRSRHLPPRGEALWRRLGRRVAGRLGRHVTI